MPRSSEALSRAALPALAAVLVVAAVWTSPAPLELRTGLVVLCAVAAGAIGILIVRRSGESGAMRELRQQLVLLGQQLDTWIWLTDAGHRLVRFQPPQGAPTSSWVESAFSGEPLWQRFDDDAHTLRTRLQSHAPLHDLVVGRLNGNAGRRWRVRGLPRLDANGRFAGYVGLAMPLDPAPDAAPGTAAQPPVAPPAAATPEADDHAAFAYTISHDLRAPIRVVEGFARILKEDYGASLDRVGNDHLDRVLAAAARMNAMIDAMLSLSRLSTLPLARVPVDLTHIARQVADDLRCSAPQRQADIRIEPGLGATGDPALLRIALENLLGNAWKYSAKVAQTQIAFERIDKAGQKVFVVRDNGAGFDMHHAERLFGVFCRLHGSSEFAGNGVGLASVRRIVRRHGGEIWAEAEAGQGARFYFTLGH